MQKVTVTCVNENGDTFDVQIEDNPYGDPHTVMITIPNGINRVILPRKILGYRMQVADAADSD
jgi:hypothetical protein